MVQRISKRKMVQFYQQLEGKKGKLLGNGGNVNARVCPMMAPQTWGLHMAVQRASLGPCLIGAGLGGGAAVTAAGTAVPFAWGALSTLAFEPPRAARAVHGDALWAWKSGGCEGLTAGLL